MSSKESFNDRDANRSNAEADFEWEFDFVEIEEDDELANGAQENEGDEPKIKRVEGVKITGVVDKTLRRVVFPEKIEGEPVIDVAQSALRGCDALEEVVFPDSALQFDRYLFDKCKSLRTVKLGASLYWFDFGAFSKCASLTSIEVPLNRPPGFHSSDGALFSGQDDASRQLLAVPPGKNGVYVVPDGVVAIEQRAFGGCDKLTAIETPPTLRTIADNAFNGCVALESIALCEGLETIEKQAFSGCLSLEKLELPKSLRTVENDAFWRAAALKTIEVAPGNERFRSVDGVLFSADGKTLLAFPPNRGGEYVVPDGVETIADRAFAMCGLESIVLPETLRTIGKGAFVFGEELSSVALPESLREIGDGAFWGCASLESIEFPGGLETINFKAFTSSGFDFREIFNGEIGRFWSARNNLREYRVSPTNPRFRSVDGVVFSADGKTLAAFPPQKKGAYVVPDGVETIGAEAFGGSPLKAIAFPKSLRTIETAAFADSSLISVCFSEGLRTIGENAFSRCKGLTSLDLPVGLQTIGANAFNDCWDLTEVAFPDGLKEIGDSAFYQCKLTEPLAFPDGLRKIGASAFSWCDVPSITFGAGALELGERAFANCEALESLTFGAVELSRIPQGAFWGAKKLTSLVLSDGVKAIDDFAFDNCETLESVVFPASLQRIDDEAFGACSALRSATFAGFDGDDEGIAEDAFRDCAADLTFYAPLGSGAEIFARCNGFRFAPLDERGADERDG